MERTPYEDLIKRCQKIESEKGKTLRELFMEANVDPACIYYWKRREVDGMVKRSLLLAMANVLGKVDETPGISTFEAITKITNSEDLTKIMFDQAGFLTPTFKQWKISDPNYVESYKRVQQVVTNYEKSI